MLGPEAFLLKWLPTVRMSWTYLWWHVNSFSIVRNPLVIICMLTFLLLYFYLLLNNYFAHYSNLVLNLNTGFRKTDCELAFAALAFPYFNDPRIPLICLPTLTGMESFVTSTPQEACCVIICVWTSFSSLPAISMWHQLTDTLDNWRCFISWIQRSQSNVLA